jgi:hypothetical protein
MNVRYSNVGGAGTLRKYEYYSICLFLCQKINPRESFVQLKTRISSFGTVPRLDTNSSLLNPAQFAIHPTIMHLQPVQSNYYQHSKTYTRWHTKLLDLGSVSTAGG